LRNPYLCSMKSLLEISKIVTKKRVSKIEIFDEQTLKRKKSKFNEFYEALQSGKFATDQGAATFLYDTSPTDDRYRQLKSRFRKRLLDTLFFLDVNRPAASSYDRAYFTCNKDWTLVKILLANNADDTAALLARQILKRGLKYKFADVIVNCARILRKYSAETGDEKNFELYDQYGKQYQDILNAEIRSEEFFQRVTMHYTKPFAKIKILEEKISTYCQALESLSEMFDSPVLVYTKYLVWVYRYHMIRDFQSVIATCEKIEEYAENNPNYYQASNLETVYVKKMSAYLHLNDFDAGRMVAETAFKKLLQGSNAWYELMEHYFLLAIQTDNVNQAFGIYQRAVGHKMYKKMDVEVKNKWYLFELYLQYFFRTSSNDPNRIIKNTRKSKFKLGKFLNEPVLFPLKYRIFSIQSIIVQILFFIDQKKYELAADKIDQLRVFANRLNSIESFRIINFIRLLQQLSKANFDVNQISIADKYYQRLLEQPMYYRGASTELEVIPWEKLWNHLLNRLQA